MLLITLLLNASSYAMHSIVDNIAQNIIEEKDGITVVKPAVAALLRNDGLFTQNSDPIPLNDAAEETKRTWFNKEWVHTPTQEDMEKAGRIDQGNEILSALYHENIEGQPADTIIAYGGVLPSVMKMFLAVEKVAEVRRLIIVTEPTDQNVEKTSLENYERAATLLKGHEFPVVTQETKPHNGKEVVELVRQGFVNPNLEITYVTKKELPNFVKDEIKEPTNVVVASSYPQLEAHVLTYAALSKENPNWQVVAGVTAGAQPDLESFYDAFSKEAHYNFDRNNFARILHRLAEYYNKAQ